MNLNMIKAIDIVLAEEDILLFFYFSIIACFCRAFFLFINDRIIYRSRIENEGYDGMEVADMLSDVMWDLVNDAGEKVSPKIKVSSEDKRQSDLSLPESSSDISLTKMLIIHHNLLTVAC